MTVIYWLIILGLMFLTFFLALLHKGLMSEYTIISKFPVPKDLEIAVKIVYGIFMYFYAILIISIFILTKFAVS